MFNQSQQAQQPKPTIGFWAVTKYALLPGIIPMLRRLAERLGHFLHIFTMIFGAAGLIDKNHPCLRPENIGRYRFVDILGVAAQNVIFDKKHIPQVVMFFAVILTIVLSISILATTFFHMVLGSSHAFAQAAPAYFSQTNESTDIAFKFLREMFGKTGLNGLWDGVDENYNPFANTTSHQQNTYPLMLKAMLQHYSFALLIIAVFQIIYLMVIVLVDSAKTGEPFGKRFNNVWAPIRLAMGIGLLVPIGGGYNCAQLITFQMTHWGSALATNVWTVGLTTLQSSQFLSATQPGPGYRVMRGLFDANLCVEAWNKYEKSGQTENRASQIPQIEQNGALLNIEDVTLFDPAAIISGSQTNASFGSAKDRIVINYGTLKQSDYCGSFSILNPALKRPIVAMDFNNSDAIELGDNDFIKSAASENARMFFAMDALARKAAKIVVAKADDDGVCDMRELGVTDLKELHNTFVNYWRTYKAYDAVTESYYRTPAYKAQLKKLDDMIFAATKQTTNGGWATAGSVFLSLAQANSDNAKNLNKLITFEMPPQPLSNDTSPPGLLLANSDITKGFISALCSAPFAGLVSSTCESVLSVRSTNKLLDQGNNWFTSFPMDYPSLTQNIRLDTWRIETQKQKSSSNTPITGDNEVLDNLNAVVYNNFVTVEQDNMHPLGHLMAMGEWMFNGAVMLMVAGIVVSRLLSETAGNLILDAAIPLFIGGITLTFIVPMTPFLNFMFAVIEWVASVFEAIIGMPLWALSFISISGEDLGQTAQAGFMKLIEIMLRPTIIIFALLGTFMMFSAAVHYFNSVFQIFKWSVDHQNHVGLANVVSYIFYLFAYTFIVYSIGNSMFKLITVLPNNFMRWINGPSGFNAGFETGANISSFVANQAYSKVSGGMASMGKSANKRAANKGAHERANEERNEANNANAEATQAENDARTSRDQVNNNPHATMDDLERSQAMTQRAVEMRKEANDKKYAYMAKTGAKWNKDKNQFDDLTPEQHGKYRQHEAEYGNKLMSDLHVTSKSRREREQARIDQFVDQTPKQEAKEAQQAEQQEQRQAREDMLRELQIQQLNKQNQGPSASMDDLKSFQDSIKNVARTYGTNSPQLKMANDFYKLQTDGQDFYKDITPKTLDAYRSYMDRPKDEREKLEQALLGP